MPTSIHTKSPIQTLEIPSASLHTVHIDIVAPFSPAKSPNSSYISPYRYILTCIDRTTRWVEAQPFSEITASSVAEAFINTWVTRWGVPLHVITDRGRQFESELFSEVAKIVCFYRLRTTAYHPQCNGLIVRMHRTIKTAITTRKESWLYALPIVLLGIRSMLNSSDFSPFYAVTGTQCLLPQLLIDSTSEEAITENFTKDLHKTMSQFNVRDFTKRITKSAKSYVPEKL